jgi:hypothetical protein
MLKFAKLEPSGLKDQELGRELYVTTSVRIFFRENLLKSDDFLKKNTEDFSSTRLSNDELNYIIAKEVGTSRVVKNIRIANEWGQIRYSDKFSIYFILLYNETLAKIISAKSKINEGSASKKYPSMISSGITDPISGKEIRVTTTVRVAFKKVFPYTLIPQMDSSGNLMEEKKITYPMASPPEQTNYIAKIFASRSDTANVKKVFLTKNKERAEIRSFGIQNIMTISVIRDHIDIISVQDTWRSEKMPRPGSRGSRDVLSINRPTYTEQYRTKFFDREKI